MLIIINIFNNNKIRLKIQTQIHRAIMKINKKKVQLIKFY